MVGNTVQFDVETTAPPLNFPALDFPAPRVDRVGLAGTTFTSGTVDTWLTVQVANGDVGAEFFINGNPTPAGSFAFKAMRNDLFGVNPADLAYPIYHYTAYVVAVTNQPVGSTITVQARNTDGKTSAITNYVLPIDAATQDSDGDDIPDDWEKNGYDYDNDGTIDIDLAALGADYRRPDVFVEIDVMQGLSNPPTQAVWDAFKNAFAAAPILNSNGIPGVNLILDTNTIPTVPFSNTVMFDDTLGMPVTYFNTLKNTYFDNTVRGRIYHYGIWANALPAAYSGISDVNFGLTDPSGDDFIVSLDDLGPSFNTDRPMIETVMHELGHNLGQAHGSATHDRFNPVYSSVMSYSWQLRSSQPNGFRNAFPIYAPFYYQQSGVVEVNGAVPAFSGSPGTAVDYSEGMGRTLNEQSLNEPLGLYNNNPVDWNLDNDKTDNPLAYDADRDYYPTYAFDDDDILNDYPNWSSLKFSGPRTDGTN